MIYSLSFGLYPARYPDWSGGFSVQLDQTYYQIWGDRLQVYASLSTIGKEKPEPFGGKYYVLLLNTREMPATSFYNVTKIIKYYRSENGSQIYSNTTVSASTTFLKEIATVEDILNFNLSIEIEEDLLFEDFLLRYMSFPTSEKVSMFRLEKGLNVISSEIKFTKGTTSGKILASYKFKLPTQQYNFTIITGYGYQEIFDFSIYKNLTSEHIYIGQLSYGIWLLPFSAHIIDFQEASVKQGKLFVSFPLNASLSADKIALVSYGGYPSYVVDINPVAVYSSPPVTLTSAIILILLYFIYLKWRVILFHLLKYKIFYISILLTGVLLTSQTFASIPSDATFPIILSLVCIGFISAGTVKNGFVKNESRLFWKTLSLIGILICAVPLAICTYYLLSSQISLEIYIKNMSLICPVFVMVFLCACVAGMMVNSLISYLAGIFLLIVHLGMRMWNHIQNESASMKIDVSSMYKATLQKRFSYYISELFIVAIWFIILVSSSTPIQLKDIFNFIFESNLIWFLLPLWALTYLLFQYELLKITWYRKVVSFNGKSIEWHPEVIRPKLFHKLFSLFAVISFIAKLLMQGMDVALLVNMLYMFYLLLMLSSGFAIGFIGTKNIAIRRASKEIARIMHLYGGITDGKSVRAPQ